MSDLDTTARRHAEAVRTALAHVETPPVRSLNSDARPTRWRSGALVAIVTLVAAWALLPLISPGDDAGPTAPGPGRDQPAGSDQAATAPGDPPSPELSRFDVAGFLDDRLDGAFEDVAGTIAVVALVPVGSEQHVDLLIDRLTAVGLGGYTYVPPEEVAATAARFAARHGTETLAGEWAAYGFFPELVDSPVGEWGAVLDDVPGAIVAEVPFELPEVTSGEDWDVVADLPFIVGGRGFAAAVDGDVVLVGTDGTWKVGADGTWTQGQASPLAPDAPCCEQSLPAGDHLVLTAEARDSTWALDLDTLTWRATSPRPSAGFVLGSAIVNDELIVVDSAPRTVEAVTRVAALDLATFTWRELDPLPSPVSVGGVTSDGERIIVAGTRQDGNNNIGGGHVAYAHTETDGWRPLPNIPISGQASTVAWVDGAGLLAWNYDLQSAILDESGEWRPLGEVPMDPMECYPQASVVTGGIVGICGGLAWFDAATEQWTAIPTPDQYWEATRAVLDDAVVAFIQVDSNQTRMLRHALPPSSE